MRDFYGREVIEQVLPNIKLICSKGIRPHQVELYYDEETNLYLEKIFSTHLNEDLFYLLDIENESEWSPKSVAR